MASSLPSRSIRRIQRGALIASVLLAVLAAPTALSAQTASSDSVAAVTVAHDLLRAISTRDTILARKLLLPGAQLVSIPDPAAATQGARTQSDTQFMTSLSTGTQVFVERMWSPTVFLQGPLAIVRAPYDFRLDGAFSHCGVDVFTLVKSRGEWRISHVVYTTQRANCTPPK